VEFPLKVVAIIQARMNSTRLPGKVMLDLCGETVLSRVVKRVQACEAVDQVVVATTKQANDQMLVVEALDLGVEVFCGNENDVLDRYYRAAKKHDASLVVRVTADCPLFDPEVLSQMFCDLDRIPLTKFSKIYFSNTRTRTYPRGLDAEIFNFSALDFANQEATQAFEREHVTPFMYQHPKDFLIYDFRNDEDNSAYRWTLDTPEDYEFFKAVYSELHKEKGFISTEDVFSLLKTRPELCELNAHVEQKKY
jgi:spore coat polysaccharide biosynthesis protein SpsF